jgi:hypothetical protein
MIDEHTLFSRVLEGSEKTAHLGDNLHKINSEKGCWRKQHEAEFLNDVSRHKKSLKIITSAGGRANLGFIIEAGVCEEGGLMAAGAVDIFLG